MKRKPKRAVSLGARILLAALAVTVVAVGIWQVYLTLRFRVYDGYRQEIAPAYVYGEQGEFKALTDSRADVPAPYKLALENEVLKFYIDAATGNGALYDKRNGAVEYTNPPGADEDPLSNPVNKEYLKSQMIVTYFDSNGQTAEYNSFKMAAQLNQIEVFGLTDGGLRLVYTIGDTKPKAGILPLYIKAERLDEILGGITNDDPAEAERVRGLLRRRWEDYAGKSGVVKLLDTIANNPSQQKSLITQFERLGYTHEDRMADEADTEVPGIENVGFVIPIEYRLEGDGLLVSVPTGNIAETGGASLEGIRLLPYFGAADVNETGYIVVPNGSGSIIRFNNGRVATEDYKQYVYGQDPMLAEYDHLDKVTPIRLPLFGLSKGERGVLARIENGAPLAQLWASVSGKLNGYNYVSATFVLRGAMTLDMFGGSSGSQTSIPVVEKPKAETDIRVRYTMLTGEYEGYSGMAVYERERLIREGVLTRANASGDVPFFMDLIGSTQAKKFVLDVAYYGQIPATTYKQASEIYERLKAEGISNQVINFQGWFNRGYYHDVASKIKPVSQLGKVSELEKLSSEVSKNGAFYSDVIFQKAPFSTEGHGYNWVYETSRYYGGGMVGAFGLVNPLSYYNIASFGYREIMYDLVSPKFLGRYVDSFVKAFGKYDIQGVSLRDLGDSLTSDRKRTEVIPRTQAEEIVKTNFEKLAGYPLLVSGGNYYSLGYAEAVINAPVSHNAFYIVDEEIPFYEIILSGCVDYAGTAVNLNGTDDLTNVALKMVEYGAYPHFTFTYEDASEMKYTALSIQYSTTFANWEADAVRLYNTVNSHLKVVRGASIIKHETTASGVKRVAYDNGVTIEIDGTDVRVLTTRGAVGVAK